ncbi:MAG: AgmX/PglI C-terminal domain-containing protein [Oligoflexia bacterium]|nr:AgmX/PglI C-terminal domain-containing protein [Oligoflexia bacterium]
MNGLKNNDEFLVTTYVDGKSWQAVWDPDSHKGEDPKEPFGLDHPVFWELTKTPKGIFIRHKIDGRKIPLGDDVIDKNEVIALPVEPNEPRHLSLQVRRLPPIRPAYIPDLEAYKNIGPAEHYASAGIRNFLISFNKVDTKFKARVERTRVFSLVSGIDGFQVTAYQNNVRFKLGPKSRVLAPGTVTHLSFADVHVGAFVWGSYWWRISKVGVPEIWDQQDFEDEEKVQDAIPIKTLGKIVAGLFLAFVLLSRSQYYLQMFQDSHNPPVLQTEVELKKPKIIPMEIVKRPEPPKPTPTPTPTPKKEIAKKEPRKREAPKKVAKKEPPKKRPVVAKAPQPAARTPHPKHVEPPKAVARAPHPKPAPRPKAVAQAPHPKAAPKAVAPAPVFAKAPDPAIARAKQLAQQRAQEKTQEKASLAKSLNFLSSGSKKNVAAFPAASGSTASAKYQDLGTGAVSGTTRGKSSALNRMAESDGGDGPIATRGSRNVASTGLSGKHGKGLNEVQGKVSLSALYGNGSGDELASAAGGASVSVSGPGKISDAAIEKTLAKYLQKFQYCYEKALLTDSTLAGTIQMQWTIAVGGSVSNVHVVRSALNNAGLHSCLTRELSKITFPSPSGGSVVVKKPFTFQSTTI